MTNDIHDLGSGFWNIRGTQRIGGVINVGTQCSLVQLASGKFIFLDSYTLEGDLRAQVMALTHDGRDVEAVLNVHPFHTLHCAQMARDFPQAIFYGSRRHPEQVPEVTWADDLVESDAVTQRYPELEFSLPQGIHYIASDESIHAGSLLVRHAASQSVHIDDTFITPPAKILDAVLPEIMLHPTTKAALIDMPDAGNQYCNWATKLANDWSETRNFCAAHSHMIAFKDGEFKTALLAAIDKARPKLTHA